jgi:multicomponent Na+:H+ antiporter subunit D
MSRALPAFVVVPLVVAFILPVFGRKGKAGATLVANLVTIFLLALAVACVGKTGIYEVGNWSSRVGIVLVLDGLASLMLLAVNVVAAAAMLFSVRYMEQYTAKPKYLSLFLLMVAGMNGVVITGDVFNLYVFLEIASIASYALVGFGCEHEELEASFKYMVLGSVASSLILLGIALLYGNTGALNMAYTARAIQKNGINAGLAFAMSLFIAGFGLKAALVPFHAWLPDAHPSAPAPISAMLSGVLIKALGVYALSRLIFNVFGVSIPVSWVLIALGVLSMVVGVFLAVGQWDFKRLLAYHSISQMGYVVMGIGLGALILAKGGNPLWASLAILGGLFHLVNHAVFKSLLFLASGSVEMATGTRQLKQMGGLVERMPYTRAACTIASAAIAGVPPFNGFWSKLILVIAAVQAGFFGLAAVTVVVSLVTLLSFLKVQRYVFLGELPEALRNTHETGGSMVTAMLFLASLCLLMSLLVLVPSLRVAVLQPAVDALVEGVNHSIRVANL